MTTDAAILERMASLEAKMDLMLELREDVRTIRIDCPIHRATLADHSARIAALEETVHERAGRIKTLEETLPAHTERIKTLQESVGALWGYFKWGILLVGGAVIGAVLELVLRRRP